MNNTAIRNRVPQILFLYWVIKIAATTLGETGADMFSMTFNLGYGMTIGIFFAIFLGCLSVKLHFQAYEPISYWLTFTATAIVGTAISDYIDRTLELGYALGSLGLIILLALILTLWYFSEKSLSVEQIQTSTAERFYWLAFLIANTLGTALGDYMADDLSLGFLFSALLITGFLCLISLLHYFSPMSNIVLFWLAFVMTRPLGATFGDLLTKPISEGGLNWGTIGSSIFFCCVLIFALRKEVQMEKKREQQL